VKRRRNVAIWAGFLLAVAAVPAHVAFFARFPVTRDFPWAALLMFGAGFLLIGRGLARAYRRPQEYRGRVAGPILGTAAAALLGFFAYSLLYGARQLPRSTNAPQVGQTAPAFSLPDTEGDPVTLAALLGNTEAGAGDAAGAGPARANAVLLIFYRGYW
jgi:hypothetical protein